MDVHERLISLDKTIDSIEEGDIDGLLKAANEYKDIMDDLLMEQQETM